MPKLISFKKGGLSLLLWSVIPAAFIGPGTVTTCSKAGAAFGLSLLWALTFSTAATIILQEAAARITLASGKTLGEILALKYSSRRAKWLKIMLFGAVTFGCTAYQAGNILGAVAGLALIFQVPQTWLVLAVGVLSAALLWLGNVRLIASAMAAIVFLMGLAFIAVAMKMPINGGNFLKNSLVPSLPEGAALLVIGLVGTTVVPYNLFLAGGLSKGQSVREMRWGIALAVAIGGVISMAILLAGTQIQGEFSFPALAAALENGLGKWAGILFGFGLFAAGASSAVTAPLAAAMTGHGLLGDHSQPGLSKSSRLGKSFALGWTSKSLNFKLVWMFVLGVGLAFGLAGVRPIPVIIAAQAVNGVLLPVVAVFLLLAVNDRRLMPEKFANSMGWNLVMGVVVAIAAMLGIYNLWQAGS